MIIQWMDAILRKAGDGVVVGGPIVCMCEQQIQLELGEVADRHDDTGLLAALQTAAVVVVEAPVRTQRHRLDAETFPMFRVFVAGKEFVAIWVPVGLGDGSLSP